jgi:hypothetical protein
MNAMAQDPPARSTSSVHSQARHRRPSPSKRRRAPLDINNNNGADNRNEFSGTNNNTSNQLHNRASYYPCHQHHQYQRDLIIIRAHDCQGRDARPSLRKRGSSLRPTPLSSSSRHDHVNNNNDHNNNINYSMDAASTEEELRGCATLLGKHRSSSFSSTATTIPAAATHSIKNLHSTVRLSRITAILLICILTYWALSWWMEISIDIARFTIHYVMFGNWGTTKQFYSSITTTMNDKSQQYQHDNIYEVAHRSVSNTAVGVAGGRLRGTIIDEKVSSTVHDLNAKSHLLKAKGRQILPDFEQQALLQSSVDNNNNNIGGDNDGQTDNTSNMLLDQDETNDFFFAGKVMETKRIVNNLGRIDTISYLTHSYVTLPVSLLVAKHSFAMSIWVNLSSSSSFSEYNDSNGGVAEFDNKKQRRPRVILSTRSTAKSEGCYSDQFGNISTTGFVLYAEPSIEDGTSYRIILEYAYAGAQSCRMIGFSPQNNVEVGSWHHIALFSTRISKEEQKLDRISLYVNGFLAGRTEDESSPSVESQTDSNTIIGRYTTQAEESALGSNNDDYHLDGRVGMLSIWQTESNASLSDPHRMNIQSPNDEDHVVRAILRAAFDIRSIQELSLLGLTVKEPSLLYTFDGQKGRDATIDLYSEPDRSIYEYMMGKNGTIVCKVIDGNPAHHRQNFVPLGGNRYAKYKDGSFISPQMTASERQELNEIARARSALVKKAMQHVWSGYETYAYGKDELLPLSKSGQDNWGGIGTTLVDSLRYGSSDVACF